jgi:WD40 repeat protein
MSVYYRSIFDMVRDFLHDEAMDVGSGRLLRTMFELDDLANASCLSHDEQTLAIATRPGTISLWDIKSGQLLTQWLEPGGPDRAMAFTPNDEELLVISTDESSGEVTRIRYSAPGELGDGWR